MCAFRKRRADDEERKRKEEEERERKQEEERKRKEAEAELAARESELRRREAELLLREEAAQQQAGRGARDSSEPADDEGLCVVCLDRQATHALLPCGHRCACEEHAPGLDPCPICRTPVQGRNRIFG